MKIEKYVKESADIKVDGITLLSIEEYEVCEENISTLEDAWWLRSPGETRGKVAYVCKYGINSDGVFASHKMSVRPALKIADLKSANLHIGDKFHLFNYDWTIISNALALCDCSIADREVFCEYEYGAVRDYNEYESSDVKKYVEAWFILECLTGGHKVNDADSYDLRTAAKYAASHFPVDQLIRYLPQDVETPTPTEGEEPLWREWVGRGLEIHYCT